jgi:endonuclease G
MKLKSFLFITIIFLFFGCGNIETQENVDKNTNIQDYNISNIIQQPDINITSLNPNREIENNNSTQTGISPSQSTQNTQEEMDTIIPNNLTNIIPQSQTEDIDYKNKFINSKKCNQIIDKEFFEICYNYSLKVATSVAYTLEGDLVNELNIKDRPNFYEELSIDEKYRAKDSDYRGSGFDRGHLAPDASFDWSQESLEATYSLANIIPQVPEVNRYGWAKLEQYARDKAVDLGKIEVINVVEYDKNKTKYIGKDNIGVSSGFYKILINQDESYQECFYYKNDVNISKKDDNISQHKLNCNRILQVQ